MSDAAQVDLDITARPAALAVNAGRNPHFFAGI
jgi:hypothetical protein